MITDENLKKWWSDFDTPIDDEECIEEDLSIPGVISWPKGTDRYDIWHWFDEHYSKGLSALMYGEDTEVDES